MTDMTGFVRLSALVATGTLFSFAMPAWSAEYEWRIQSNVQAGEPGYVALEEFAKTVEAMSDGRLTFQVFPTDALYSTADGLDAIGGGLIEAGMLTGAIYTGQVGPFGTLETGVPGSLNTAIERYNFFYHEGFLELCQEAFAPFNVHYLGPQLSSGWDLISKKPINGPQDFNGLRVRAYGIEAEWFESMGASTTYFGGSEIYTNLATGVVDAVRWASAAGILNGSFQEVTDYYIRPSTIAAPNNFFGVNQQAWEKLPADLQEIMAQAAVISSFEYVARAALQDTVALKKMQDDGMQVTTIDPAVWAEMEGKARELWRGYAEHDEFSRRGVEMLDAFLVKLGRG